MKTTIRTLRTALLAAALIASMPVTLLAADFSQTQAVHSTASLQEGHWGGGHGGGHGGHGGHY